MRTGFCAALLLGASILPIALRAEVYKWVDENGTVHFSQDRNTLPKGAAPADRAPEAKPVEVFDFQKRDSADPRAPAQSYTIYMNPIAGGNHVVQVQINGRITVPMMLDTGASDVVITQATAQRAGITRRDYRGTQRYSTANGVVEQPAITLREVRLGDATVKMVRGSISDSMQIGLLGASFLRQLRVPHPGLGADPRPARVAPANPLDTGASLEVSSRAWTWVWRGAP